MSNDELCKYFKALRNSIDKEGINGLSFQVNIHSLNIPSDLINPPPNSGFSIGSKGVVYLVNEGTPKEDYLPARTKGKIEILIHAGNLPEANFPTEHLGKDIRDKNILEYIEIYHAYLKDLIEEWTGIVNTQNENGNVGSVT